MHTAPMKDSEGTFEDWSPCEVVQVCRKCTSTEIWFRTWESNASGTEDHQFRCEACGAEWWIEGIDS